MMRKPLSTFVRFPILVVAVLIIGFYVVPANGDFIAYSGTNFDIQVSTPVNVGVTPLKEMTLRVIGKNGYIPNGFDSVVNSGTGITTATNSLYQIYQAGVLKTPTLTMDDDYDPIPLDLDTHFLISEGTYIPISTLPSENRAALDTTENPYGGFGNKLYGTFTLTGVPTTTWNLAQIVTKNSTTVSLNFVISGVKNGISTYQETVHSSFTVPEPSVFILLGTSVLGLLFFRRRLAG
jgi:hypothetical protein